MAENRKSRFPEDLHVLRTSEEAQNYCFQCDGVYLVDLEDARMTITEGLPWDTFANVRWPQEDTWVDWSVAKSKDQRSGWGALVRRKTVPVSINDIREALKWTFEKALEAFEVEAAPSFEDWVKVAEKDVNENRRPTFAQSSRLFTWFEGNPVHLGAYHDVLDSGGRIITSARVWQAPPGRKFDQSDIDWARICVQWLCQSADKLNAEKSFNGHIPLEVWAPTRLISGEIPPAWSYFFPERFRRSRWFIPSLEAGFQSENGGVLESSFVRANDQISRAANLELLKFTRSARPRSLHPSQYETNYGMSYLKYAASGKAIFRIPDALTTEFHHTEVEQVRCSDIRWPNESYYLSFRPPEPISLAPDYNIDGAIITRQHEEILIVATSRNPNIRYSQLASFLCAQDPCFSMHLMIKDENTTVEDALKAGIEDFLARNQDPEDDWTGGNIIDGRFESRRIRRDTFNSQRPAFESALRIIINAMCFLSAYPGDIEVDWGEAPTELIKRAYPEKSSRRLRTEASKALAEIEERGYVKINICGPNIAKAIEREPTADGDDEPGGTVRPHWRRGHWRRQRCGEGLTRIDLTWIKPVIVNADLGVPVGGHLYQIPH